MPIPKQKQGEQDDAFISRCISELVGEYEQDQAAAICYQQRDVELMNNKEWRKEFTRNSDSLMTKMFKK